MARVSSELRTKLCSEVQVTGAAELVPHHRRGGLLVLEPSCDLLDVAEAIAGDNSDMVTQHIASSSIYKPSLAQLADWCVDSTIRFQVVILQPYVLAQRIIALPAEFN